LDGPFLLGLDLGTSSLKALLLNPKGVVAVGRRPLGQTAPQAEEWWSAVREVVKGLGHRYMEQLAGVGVCGHGPGLVALSPSGSVLGEPLTWMDHRAGRVAEGLEGELGEELYRVGGHRVDASTTLVQLLWLKAAKPDDYREMRWVLSTTGYLVYRLTGEAVMDRTQASVGLLLDIKSGRLMEGRLKELGLEPTLIPLVKGSTEVVGEVSPQAARELGIPEGVPVVAGCIDGIAASLGLGVVAPGTLADVAGTSDVLLAPLKKPALDPARRVCCAVHALPGRWCLWGALSSTGAAVNWASKLLYGSRGPEPLYQEAVEAEPGARGLYFTPHLAGERTPYWSPKVRGGLFGLELHHERRDVARAVVEGVAHGVAMVAGIMGELGVNPQEVRAGGGGVTGHPLAAQLRADVMGRRVRVVEAVEPSALGAALLAGLGIGVLQDFAEAWGGLGLAERVYEPDPTRCGLYRRAHQTWRELSGLSSVMGQALL
jgi:xylulokinase